MDYTSLLSGLSGAAGSGGIGSGGGSSYESSIKKGDLAFGGFTNSSPFLIGSDGNSTSGNTSDGAGSSKFSLWIMVGLAVVSLLTLLLVLKK
jgi:hypothetical protein